MLLVVARLHACPFDRVQHMKIRYSAQAHPEEGGFDACFVSPTVGSGASRGVEARAAQVALPRCFALRKCTGCASVVVRCGARCGAVHSTHLSTHLSMDTTSPPCMDTTSPPGMVTRPYVWLHWRVYACIMCTVYNDLYAMWTLYAWGRLLGVSGAGPPCSGGCSWCFYDS